MRSAVSKGVLALSLLLSATAPVVLAAAGAPAAGAQVFAASDLLPGRVSGDLSDAYLVDATPEYVVHRRQQYDDRQPVTYTVLDVQDGSTVTTWSPEDGVEPVDPPQVVGDQLVLLHRSYGGRPMEVVVQPLAGGAAHYIDASSHDDFVHGDPDWGLVSDDRPADGMLALSFVRTGGTTVVDRAFSNPAWVGGDGSTAYLLDDDGSYALNTATGHATVLDLGAPDVGLVAVTTDRLVGLAVRDVAGVTTFHVTFLDRGTNTLLPAGDVTDDGVITLMPLGDGVAAVLEGQDGYELRPVDTATGDLGAAVATNVLDARPLGDGRLALVLDHGSTPRVARLDGPTDTPVPVADLPEKTIPALGLGFSAGRVAASWDGDDSVSTTDAVGSTGWEQTFTPVDFSDPAEKQLGWSHGTLLTETGSDGDVRHYRVSWPGGSRDVTAGSAVLSRGGAALVVVSPAGEPARTTVQDARSGAVLASYDDRTRRVVDGTWIWWMDGTTVRGLDLATGARDVETTHSCARLVDVRGRFALLSSCTSGYDGVVDLRDEVQFAVNQVSYGSRLGDGYVAWPSTSDGYTYSLHVRDVFTGEERTYGPLRGQEATPGRDFALDDAGDAAVFVDPNGRVRRADLTWAVAPVAAPLAPDTQAPVVALQWGVPQPYVGAGAGPVRLDWLASDPQAPGQKTGAVRTIDVRYQDQTSGTYTYPAGWQGLVGSATVTDQVPTNAGRCYSARATDVTGNTSAWTAPVCQYVDGTAPATGPEGGSPEFVPWTKGSLTYTWSSSARGTRVYDLQTRGAAAGKPLSGWPSTTFAYSLTTTSRTMGVSGAGTERCYRFRVHNEAGYSAWSPGRCTALPTDDRSLTRRGSTVPAKSGLAIAGTCTKLARKGASLTLAKPAGRKVGVWLLRGPGQGTANVYAGSRLIGRVSGAASTNRRDLVVLAPQGGFTGALKIVQAGTKPVKVDALSVLR